MEDLAVISSASLAPQDDGNSEVSHSTQIVANANNYRLKHQSVNFFEEKLAFGEVVSKHFR